MSSSEQALTLGQRRAIERWAASGRAVAEQMEAFAGLVGCDCDSPMIAAIWHARDAHTNAVALLVEDEGDWLAWFAHECDFGAQPREVIFKSGQTVMVDSVDRLIDVILANRVVAPAEANSGAD